VVVIDDQNMSGVFRAADHFVRGIVTLCYKSAPIRTRE
jgi:hypothetical protein